MHGKPTVMLIDDNDVDNFINRRIIENQQFSDRIYVHTSSKSALEFLKNFEQLPDFPEYLIPSILFLDISMPVMDGYAFMSEFTKINPDFRSKIRVIVLTSSTNSSEKENFMKIEGVSDYFNKPLTVEHLNQLREM